MPCPPRSTAKPSSRCASPGWWRIAGGRLSRCDAATGSWWASEDATWSSSTTCSPAAGFSKAPEMAVSASQPSRINGGTPPYVELHCHSAYSFLDGVSLPQELAQRAGELGYTTLALTDHNSVSGSMELAEVAAGHGVRAIHGAEIDLAVDPPEDAGG